MVWRGKNLKYQFFLSFEEIRYQETAAKGAIKKLEIENKDPKEIYIEMDSLKGHSQRFCKSHYLKLITSLRISFFPF